MKTATKTYSAQYTGSGIYIYSRQPNGNLVGELPLGTVPAPRGRCGTLDRTDGGDPFERAIFLSALGHEIVVRLDD